MKAVEGLSKQGRRLLQVGVALFLFTSLEGFAVSYLAVPRLGLSVHTLAAFEGVLLVAMGLVWPRLELSVGVSRIAFWFLVYSAFATLIPYALAAVWGAGNSIIPLAAGNARGTPTQEAVIDAVLYSAAPTGIIAFALILWGLRGSASTPPG